MERSGGEFVVTIPEGTGMYNDEDVEIEQDIGLLEVRDFKEQSVQSPAVDTEKKLGDNGKRVSKDSMATQCDFGKKSATSARNDGNKARSASVKGPKENVNENRLHSLKMPQAVVAFAQAAAKVNELPGWPLQLPSKVQMKKCEKCSREFCSTLNYRRHVRLHRRSLNDDKDLRKERSHLAAFWSKLTVDQASEVVSFKNLETENLSGTLAVQVLSAFIQQPSNVVSFPHAYMKAGTALLEIVQNKAFVFPIHAEKLLKVLEDASEGTFLCGGTSAAIQRFVFQGDAEKIGLEDKNIVASMSFLVEQKLLKAWMAERDVEAMRCERALVEEEEAAQRKRAKVLEKKQQRRIRQKERKGQDQNSNPGSEHGDEELNTPRGEEYEDLLQTGSSSSSVISSLEGVDTADVAAENGYVVLQGSHTWSSVVEIDAEETSREEKPENDLIDVEDKKTGGGIKERRRLSMSMYRTRRDDGSLYFKSRRVQHSTRSDYVHYRKKLTPVYRGIVKGGSGREKLAVWTRKGGERESLLVGSLSVPLVNSKGAYTDAKQPKVAPPTKVWKAVSKASNVEDEQKCEQKGTLPLSPKAECMEKGSKGEDEQDYPPKLKDVVVLKPVCEENESTSLLVDFLGKSSSPTSELLANFLSERWASAIEGKDKYGNEAEPVTSKHRKRSKNNKVWPINDDGSFAQGDNGVVQNRRNFVANSCGKDIGRWHRGSAKNSEQRYMPRRQISTA